MRRLGSGHFGSAFGAGSEEDDEYNFDIDYGSNTKTGALGRSKSVTSFDDDDSLGGSEDSMPRRTYKPSTPAVTTIATRSSGGSAYNVMEHAQALLNRYNQTAGKQSDAAQNRYDDGQLHRAASGCAGGCCAFVGFSPAIADLRRRIVSEEESDASELDEDEVSVEESR